MITSIKNGCVLESSSYFVYILRHDLYIYLFFLFQQYSIYTKRFCYNGCYNKINHIASSDGRTMPLFGFGYFDIGADNFVIKAIKHAVKTG